MPKVRRQGFDLHYESVGPADGRPLVLIAGLGEQIGSVEFPHEHVAMFAERGYRVIRIDNRDNGLSVPDPEPDAPRIPDDLIAVYGAVAPPPYSLADMADDVVAVLDAAAIDAAAVVGASMGGFIARMVAIRHPARVNCLMLVMTGAAAPAGAGPQMSGESADLIAMGVPRPREQAIEAGVTLWRENYGTGYGFEEDWVRERLTASLRRSYRPEGVMRNLMALAAPNDLWERQTEIACPVLVLHGGRDVAFEIDHAQAMVDRMQGASLWFEERMGHTMHRELWPQMIDRLDTLCAPASDRTG